MKYLICLLLVFLAGMSGYALGEVFGFGGILPSLLIGWLLGKGCIYIAEEFDLV